MDIEPELYDLRAAAGLLGHMATSQHEIDPDELVIVRGRIIAHHDRDQNALGAGFRAVGA